MAQLFLTTLFVEIEIFVIIVIELFLLEPIFFLICRITLNLQKKIQGTF